MSKRRKRTAALGFERVREQLGRVVAGVHSLGGPAAPEALARLAGLPPAWRELYASWNGMSLYQDTVVLEPLERLREEDGLLRVGEVLGAALYADAAGRLLVEDDDGDLTVQGSALEPWLEAVLAREAVMHGADGEWRDVFADEAGELKPAVRRKRAQLGLKHDPGAAAWHLEAAELAIEEGADPEQSIEAALAADDRSAPAWELGAAWLAQAGKGEDAERAYVRAAEASRRPARAAERWAEAARLAAEGGREAARAAHAERARGADADLAARLEEEARALADDGDVDGALRRAALAAAVEPGGSAAELLKGLRARRALRLV